jgi:type I restriction enzyme R subunit
MTPGDRNEAQTRHDLIDPALRAAGWGVIDGSRIQVEVIAPGRLHGAGRRGEQEKADYVLVYRNQKLAVIEAKREGLPVTEGLGQAKKYATKLQTPFTYSTNGHGIYQVDMRSGSEGDVDAYPSPDELWDTSFGQAETKERHWRERFSAVPFEDKGGQWQPRYYQHNAIQKTLDALAQGRDRVLLTLATGTGKTAIAFQLAWKLYRSRWNLTDWRNDVQPERGPSRRPRILFLADRNILANQAFNAFSAFPDDALVRIAPDQIRKRGRVPKNGSVFFTIFQTFMSGSDENGEPKPNFGGYPPDFFDFIVIDECHRGGASDESNWRGILEYFKPAVQLGLTATPKREANADTYKYFGEPVYVYSLKEGINDGYLTPFKVKQIDTTLDEYVYTPDDMVMEGEPEQGKRYGEEDFNRIIEIKEREKKRVEIFMGLIDQSQKTLVFCANQAHALAVRDLINQLKMSDNVDYCHRVTANDGAVGEQHLKRFQDNEKTIPTILTTSQKLSTGVDARNVRNIVLMRPVNSMIEFKQIIGRGTRIFDGKDHFTIYDFVEAYKLFNDPEWDGEPEEPVVVGPKPPPVGPDKPDDDSGEAGEPTQRPEKIKIQLAKGKELIIQHMVATSFWSPDGKPMSATEFIQSLYGQLPDLFKDEDELRKLWSHPDTRRDLLDGLSERGFSTTALAEIRKLINAEQSDLYDVLAHIAYLRPPITREERVANHRSAILKGQPQNAAGFLDFILGQYVREGVAVLANEKLKDLIELKYHSVQDAVDALGPAPEIRKIFVDLQRHLFDVAEAA